MSDPDQSDRPDGEQAGSTGAASEQPTATGATASGATASDATPAGSAADETATRDTATAGTTTTAGSSSSSADTATTAIGSTPLEDATEASDADTADAHEAAGPTTTTGRSDDDLSDEEVDRILGGEDEEEHRSNLKPALLGVLGGVVLSAIVVGVLMLTLGSGFLLGPGSPDDTASEAVAALASKDPARLGAVTCKGPDGAPIRELPAQALQVIQAVRQTGPPTRTLDTEAQAPITLTLSAQGQTQELPAGLVLGVTDNAWCMNGIAQTQQQ